MLLIFKPFHTFLGFGEDITLFTIYLRRTYALWEARHFWKAGALFLSSYERWRSRNCGSRQVCWISFSIFHVLSHILNCVWTHFKPETPELGKENEDKEMNAQWNHNKKTVANIYIVSNSTQNHTCLVWN